MIDKIASEVTARVLESLGIGDPGTPAGGGRVGRFVVVTSTTRDIWCGAIESETTKDGATRVALRDARNVLYYGAGEGDQKGIGSLGTVGPVKGSKIGPPVSRVTVLSAAAVIECSDAAVAAFGAAGWGK